MSVCLSISVPYSRHFLKHSDETLKGGCASKMLQVNLILEVAGSNFFFNLLNPSGRTRS
jgi:hypothetical protein